MTYFECVVPYLYVEITDRLSRNNKALNIVFIDFEKNLKEN